MTRMSGQMPGFDRAVYEEYLNSPQWHRLRVLALERAKYCCERCGWTPKLGPKRWHGIGLHAHHRNYKTFGNEDLDDLQVLCRSCHAKQHGRELPRPRIIRPAPGQDLNDPRLHSPVSTPRS